MHYILIVILAKTLIALFINLKFQIIDNKFHQGLSFFVYFLSFHILYIFMCDVFNVSQFIDVIFPFNLVYGPIFYFSFQLFLGNTIPVKRFLAHLTPFFLFAVSFFLFIVFPEYRILYGRLYYTALNISAAIVIFGYVTITLFNYRHIRIFNLQHSTAHLIIVGMLLLITASKITLTVFSNNLSSVAITIKQIAIVFMYLLLLIEVTLVISFQIAILGKKRSLSITPTTTKKKLNNPLYYKSLIPEASMDLYEQRLTKLMDENKIFQNMELSLEDLSKQISIPKHHLTQLLNVRMKKTFNEYINELRVDYACDLLKQNQDAYTMEALAYKCGFNSKVTFYRNFKRFKGNTPKEFRNY